jgi:hypothetical protein
MRANDIIIEGYASEFFGQIYDLLDFNNYYELLEVLSNSIIPSRTAIRKIKPMLNVHKEGIIREILVMIKGGEGGGDGVGGEEYDIFIEGILPKAIKWLKEIGITWPEFDIITKSFP